VFLLILESLGSTELLFILAMALVFFGPRKLPQLSRSLGKSLAEFRRASDDFKRTWAREATLEESNGVAATADGAAPARENSILQNEQSIHPLELPTIETVTADRVIARQPHQSGSLSPSDTIDLDRLDDQAQSSRKRDWL
jgi:TatA/E family protein of Tat protein translocase